MAPVILGGLGRPPGLRALAVAHTPRPRPGATGTGRPVAPVGRAPVAPVGGVAYMAPPGPRPGSYKKTVGPLVVAAAAVGPTRTQARPAT